MARDPVRGKARKPPGVTPASPESAITQVKREHGAHWFHRSTLIELALKGRTMPDLRPKHWVWQALQRVLTSVHRVQPA